MCLIVWSGEIFQIKVRETNTIEMAVMEPCDASGLGSCEGDSAQSSVLSRQETLYCGRLRSCLWAAVGTLPAPAQAFFYTCNSNRTRANKASLSTSSQLFLLSPPTVFQLDWYL